MLERGLVVSDPQWKDIVKEEKRHCAHIKRTFQGQVLGYVTPVSLKSSHQHVCAPLLLFNNTFTTELKDRCRMQYSHEGVFRRIYSSSSNWLPRHLLKIGLSQISGYPPKLGFLQNPILVFSLDCVSLHTNRSYLKDQRL